MQTNVPEGRERGSRLPRGTIGSWPCQVDADLTTGIEPLQWIVWNVLDETRGQSRERRSRVWRAPDKTEDRTQRRKAVRTGRRRWAKAGGARWMDNGGRTVYETRGPVGTLCMAHCMWEGAGLTMTQFVDGILLLPRAAPNEAPCPRTRSNSNDMRRPMVRASALARPSTRPLRLFGQPSSGQGREGMGTGLEHAIAVWLR
ncbi:hypothetical protein P171DRAFT_90257 [Karstenula rhodostoma CBS 690.94]|uniref:Uncharacterized protein n=1 Tax=Karstenula rhodostoma CBS 690.94 TaxID=1392251 RepID=A0A9P4PDE9_9PLEO|nr:hypothetical protein P171DRAFT_90257 [Karstenula rhodostoma CBS 690.94]